MSLKTISKNKPTIQYLDKGKQLYSEGVAGQPWRIVSGAVRLSNLVDDAPFCAGIAVAGDIIGLETLNGACTAFEVSALTFCLLEPWVPKSDAEIYQVCALQPQRAAELLSLRTGPAESRVRRLIAMLSRNQGPNANLQSVALPSLRDIGDVTDIALQTVSRIFSHWRNQGHISGRSIRDGLRANLSVTPESKVALRMRATM